MAYDLYKRMVLKVDFPEFGLIKGDIATIVDYHEANEAEGTHESLRKM